jgi:type I restriction enzyme S subunit
VQLRDIIADISAGYSAKSDDRKVRSGEIGVLKVSAVSYGIFQPGEHKAVLKEDRQNVKRSPQAGDLIMSRSNGTPSLVGACVYVDKNYPDLYLPDTLWRIKVEERTLAKWLNYALASGRMRARIRSASYGTSGMKKLSMKRLRSLKIAIPPRPEQRRIAGVLSTWDRALQQIDDLIAAKERRKKALMQQLLTGQTRLPGFGEAPWHKQQIGYHFEYFSNRNKGDKDLTILSCSKVYGIIPQADRFDKRIASKDISNYKIVEQGDLIYDPMLLWDGSIGFLNAVEKGVVSPAYYTFHFQGDELDQQFFSYLFQSHYMKYQYGAISQGTNARRKKAPRGAFLDIEVHLPQKEERHAIADILSTCDEELELLRTERQALQKQKKGMMQKLLTGTVHVPADHPVDPVSEPAS